MTGLALPSWLGLGLILLAAVLLYWPALDTPFFADDYLFLDQVRGRSLVAALAAPDPIGNFYRPVSRSLYFWLITRAAGESALVFHAVGLALLLGALALLFAVTRRLAGARAGVIAAAVLALHYAADVPVRWAAGSQELLAVSGALGALLLHLQGRRVVAAVALLAAALSKETVLLTPLIAATADRRAGERWMSAAGRAWPLGVAVGAWLAMWLALSPRHAQPAANLSLGSAGAVAALAHLGQVVLGLEWRMGEIGHVAPALPPLLPLALVLAAAAGAGLSAPDHPAAAHPVRAGLWWALLGTIPIAAVAHIWSAYYYLFSMCGVAAALGAWLTRRRWWAVAATAIVAVGSASGRGLDEFAVARSPWTAQSHINRFYIDRASHQASRYLESLKRARPAFAPSSTVFFAGLKGSVAFQTADGPLLRWAYRDSSLRSYYVNQFTREKAERGPIFLFIASGDTLRELEPGPDLLSRIALGLILSDQLAGARDALALERERVGPSRDRDYWLAWVNWALGDTAAARRSLASAGVTPDPGPTPETPQAMAAVSAGDTLNALRLMRTAAPRHALDAAAHALLADLSLMVDPEQPAGVIEALAARALAPNDPFGWRRWGMLQTHRQRYAEALESFERYFERAGAAGRSDAEAHRWVATIESDLRRGSQSPEEPRE